jgi:hypothetical protein
MTWFGELNAYRIIAGFSIELLVMLVIAFQLFPRTVEETRKWDSLLFSFALFTSPVSGIIIGSFSAGGLVIPWLLFGIFCNLVCYGVVSVIIKLINIFFSEKTDSHNINKENNT